MSHLIGDVPNDGLTISNFNRKVVSLQSIESNTCRMRNPSALDPKNQKTTQPILGRFDNVTLGHGVKKMLAFGHIENVRMLYSVTTLDDL